MSRLTEAIGYINAEDITNGFTLSMTSISITTELKQLRKKRIQDEKESRKTKKPRKP